MTKAQLLIDLKNMLGPGVDVDDTGLTYWLNEAYLYACDAIKQNNPDYFTKTATADTVADQQEYDLPTDLDKVLMVNLNVSGSWVRCMPLPNINSIPVHANTESGQGYSVSSPGYYIVKDNIGFIPIPDESRDEAIKLWYVYTPAELSDDDDEPEFPKGYHHLLKYGAYANYMDRIEQHSAAENTRARFESRVQDMVENLNENQVDEPKSIIITENHNLYQNGDDYI